MQPYTYVPRPKETEPKKKKSSGGKFFIFLLIIALPAAGYWLGTNPDAIEKVIPSTAEHSTATSTATSTETTAENQTESEPTADTSAPSYTPPATTPPPAQTSYTPPTAPPVTVVTAYITEINDDVVGLDYIAIYKGADAVPQMIRDGLCPAYDTDQCELEDGIYYRNTDPTIHWFTLFPTAEFQTWTGSEEHLSRIKRRIPSETPYSVTLNSYNQIIKIKEIYKK